MVLSELDIYSFKKEQKVAGKTFFATKHVVSVGFGKRFVYQLEPLTISEENDIYNGGLVGTKGRSDPFQRLLAKCEISPMNM